MRVGVYGGSFDPPHAGHLAVSCWLRWTGRVDEVWWVPVADHPFGKPLSPFATRVRWCRAALEGWSWGRVETIEAELPVPSYTLHTLRALAARHPAHALSLIVGADVLADVPRWKGWDEIRRDFAPIVVGRVGYPRPPDTVEFPNVSSRDIRARVREGRPIDTLVPASIQAEVEAAFRAPPAEAATPLAGSPR